MEAARSKAKVMVVGASAVGKRSLVHRSAYDPVDDRYVTTMGAKVSKKEILLPVRLRDGTYIDLILWTINPWFSKLAKTSLVRGGAGILAVCDATRRKTLDDLDDPIETVYRASGEVPIVLAVNKCDLAEQRQIRVSDLESFARKYQAEFLFTSTRSGENVEEAFQAIGERIVIHRRLKVANG